ncbi:glycosyltransferase family 4 protein [Ascidiimonas sp. W6]|uniref:glycosyltransferase family 4 protein n=1 Tax=Ascidiimonas meishanensis TaxID=3128903 RepID=UPI0030EBD634
MKKILIVGFVWPEPNSSAAGRHMMNLILFFKEMLYQVTFVTTAKHSDFMADLSGLDVQTKVIKLNDSSFDDFAMELNPHIVLFDRYMTEEQFGWRIAKNCPNAIRILDTEDLHFLRNARETSIEQNGTLENVHLITDLAKREIASIYRCDLTLVIAEYEMELLKSEFNIPEYLLVYFPLISSNTRNSSIFKSKTFEERRHFISIGNFRHAPNKDAVLILKNQIWNQIRKQLPQAELHIYGAYCNEAIYVLNNKKEGFIVKGRAKSVQEIMQNARVYLAPLRFGAGIKGKLLDAMDYDLPGITTSIGAESMQGSFDWNGAIHDDFDAFATAAINLYQDENLWNKCVKNGRILRQNRFDKFNAFQRLAAAIERITVDLSSQRKKNFTGAMLMHHTLQSSRYLSKYIELKNKKE